MMAIQDSWRRFNFDRRKAGKPEVTFEEYKTSRPARTGKATSNWAAKYGRDQLQENLRSFNWHRRRQGKPELTEKEYVAHQSEKKLGGKILRHQFNSFNSRRRRTGKPELTYEQWLASRRQNQGKGGSRVSPAKSVASRKD